MPQDKSPRFDPNNGTDVQGNDFHLPYHLTDGVGDPKTQVGEGDAVVYSSGGGDPIAGLSDGGTYYAHIVDPGNNVIELYDAPPAKGGHLIHLGPSLGTGRSHSIVRQGTLPSGDATATSPATITAGSDTFRGVAVTATNSDDLSSVGVAMGFSGVAAVSLSGAINVMTVSTTAFIGSGTQVNCGNSLCTANVAGAGSDQSVRVAAASQFHQLGVAASVAGGTVGVGPAAVVRVLTLTTEAHIDGSAVVNARKDIQVTARASEGVISVAAAAAGGLVGVAATVTVSVLHIKTHAFTGNAVTLSAGNNLLVAADDSTKLTLITASLAGGFVGVGIGVGVAVIDKEVFAYLGTNNTADARAGGAAQPNLYDGTYTATAFGKTGSFHGLAVQASSNEDLLGVAAAAGGGFVGIAGGIGVDLLHVTTKAYIDSGSAVNTNGGGSTNQSVNVTAVDAAHTLTVGGGIAGGFVGVAGGIDIGVLKQTVQAYLGQGSTVDAVADVGVNALSRKHLQTYAVSIGVGVVGVAGSVSVWTVGTEPSGGTTYNPDANGPQRGAWTDGTSYNKGDVVTFGGNTYSATADNTAPHSNPAANPGQWQQDQAQDPTANSHGSTRTNGDQAASGTGSGGWTSVLGSGTSTSGSFQGQWVSGTSYHAGDTVTSAGTGTDRGGWTAHTFYSHHDIVTFNGVRYSALMDDPNETVDPSQNKHGWQAEQTYTAGKDTSGAVDPSVSPDWNAGNGAGPTNSRINTATFGNDRGGWSSGVAYQQGDVVSFGGKKYTAQIDNPDQGTDPATNTGQWALGAGASGEAAAGSPGATLTSDGLQPDSVPAGTVAAIDGTVHAGGRVFLTAHDGMEFHGLAGAIAAGLGALGAGILIVNINGNVETRVGSHGSISAGSGGGDNFTDYAGLDSTVGGLAFTGKAGIIAAGGQVIVITDTSTQNAHIDSGATIPQAGGLASVTAHANRQYTAQTFDVGLGAAAIGVTVIAVLADGDATATVGDVQVGGGGPVGGISVSADDNFNLPVNAISAEGGIVGLSGVIAYARLNGKTRASSGAWGTVGGLGASVSATGTHVMTADTFQVTIGGLALGITVAQAYDNRATEAVMASSHAIHSDGAVSVTANSTNDV
ncbi:MAG TPA: carbohydrate-binding protein, partial [Nakamurella sp.]